MKKIIIFLFLAFIIYGCSTSKPNSLKKPLYEVLTMQNDGGANFRFYEILTDEKEIKMLLGDSNLKNKIKITDINTSNFVILNMGEQTSNDNIIQVNKVEETNNNIIIFVEDGKKKINKENNSENTNPYTVLKINSKKEIIFK